MTSVYFKFNLFNFSLLLDNEFDALEDVWFTSAPQLTITSVELLMQKCPELRSLGQLSGWSMEQDDLAILRGIVKSSNSCLALSPSSIFP